MAQSSFEPNRTLAFWALVSVFLVDFLGYAYIVPILPEWKKMFSLSSTEATALVSLWALPLLILGPLSGKITDKVGAGKVIFGSVIMLVFAALLYLVATEKMLEEYFPGKGFTILAIARIIHGISGAAVLTSGLAAASELWPNNFGEQAGKLIGIATIGGLMGPVIGGLAFELGESLAFIVLAILTALCLPIVIISVPHIGKGSTEKGIEPVPIRAFLSNPMLLRIGLLIVFTSLATGALEAGVPLLLSEPPLTLGPGKISMVILLLVFLQGTGSWWWGRLVDRKEPTRYMIMGWIGVTLSLLIAGVTASRGSSSEFLYFVILMLCVFQFSVAAAQIPMLPMIDTATSQAYGRGGSGLAFGAFGTAWATGTLIGPLAIGILKDVTGSWAISLGMLAIPGILGLVMTLQHRESLMDCYQQEMQNRIQQESAEE